MVCDLYNPLKCEPNKTGTTSPDDTKTSHESDCWCGRDFTVDELKVIVAAMRKTEGIKSFAILQEKNCPLPSEDKTYERVTEELNKVCEQYEINTCIRKAHFLCQIYWESARFQTTVEFASGNGYDPGKHAQSEKNGNTVLGDGRRYRGRGFMQLTWRNNYKRYFTNLIQRRADLFGSSNGLTADTVLNRKDIFQELKAQGAKDFVGVDYAGLVANNLFVSLDSAGWFWCYGVILSNGSALNLNTLADLVDEKQVRISQLVNGGGNGKNERAGFYKDLKNNVMTIPTRCKNFKDKK